MDSTPEFLLTKYEEVEFIDRGEYGRVYECTRDGVTTAVKVLNALDPKSRKRFEREVNILRRIKHENVVKVLDAGETDGHQWYESEYANEGHLGVMAGYLFYTDADRVKYFRQICLGVQALHESEPQIIHRDLKPSNILVFEYLKPERRIVLKVADFGIAAIVGDKSGLTTTGAGLGTPHYMAPERKKNPKIETPQSDIYSLGISFLEACTGDTTPSQDNLDLMPGILRPVIEKMIRKYPEQRYKSVSEILEELNSFSTFQLLSGREPLENESGTMICSINISRELENALNALFECDSDTVLGKLAVLERTLDRLGAARDHEAHTIMSVPRPALALIEEADRDALRILVQRFDNAASETSTRNWYPPVPDQWCKFLVDTFAISSYRATKCLCLDILAKFLERFGCPWTKYYLYHTITKIEDPSYMDYLAERLCEVGREDIAVLLEGAPSEHPLDYEALKNALHGAD